MTDSLRSWMASHCNFLLHTEKHTQRVVTTTYSASLQVHHKRSLNHVHAACLSPCDNNPGVCVKAADGAALTGRGANGRNPMALWGERGPLRIIIIIIMLGRQMYLDHTQVDCVWHDTYLVFRSVQQHLDWVVLAMS
jgi:hypothetical protein